MPIYPFRRRPNFASSPAFRQGIVAIAVGLALQGPLSPLRAAEQWFTEVDARPLVTVKAGLLGDELPGCFQVLDGDVSAVNSPNADGAVVVQSAGKSRVACAVPKAERSVLSVEVKPSAKGGVFAFTVATKPDKKRVELGYQLVIRTSGRTEFSFQAELLTPQGPFKGSPHVGPGPGPTNPSLISIHLKPTGPNAPTDRAPKREKGKKAAEPSMAETADVPPFHQRWLKLRVELSPEEARFWAEGILIGSVENPSLGEADVCFDMSGGEQIRNFRAEAAPQLGRGFLPLDLEARFNGGELPAAGGGYDDASLPPRGRVIEVGGVPFLWSAKKGPFDHVDLARAAAHTAGDYWRTSAADNDPARLMLRVPRRQYREMAIIAASDPDRGASNMLAVRMLKPMEAVSLDSTAATPAWNATTADGALRLPCGWRSGAPGAASKEGSLWLIRIPLDPGAFQNYLTAKRASWLEMELLQAPSKRDKRRPGVHIYAATLIESPVEMFVDSPEPGNVFVAPEKPAFQLHLRNTSLEPRTGTVEVAWKDSYGKQRVDRVPYAIEPKMRAEIQAPAMADVRGLHDLDATLLAASGEKLIHRHTTYANLPPDDRDVTWAESPFGMWLFSTAHYGVSPEEGATLLSRIGVRWSFIPETPEFINRFHIMPTYHGLMRYPNVEAAMKDIGDHPYWTHMAVFEETSLGPRHYGYFFPELLEKPAPMELTPEEEVKFKAQWDKAIEFCKAARERYPKLKLIFGNGSPHFIATFLARGFPREYIDGFALDYLGDRIYLFYYLREVARHYGYGDVPLDINEGFYVGSARGFYPSRESELIQSQVYIQGMLRGLAVGIERFGAACDLYDSGGGYYFTGYGNIGLCHKGPELNPKPGYTAYGTMTRMLDRAKFTRLVPTGSTVTYVAEFAGKAGPVYAAWTISGRRPLAFTPPAGHASARVTDGQGNSRELQGGGPVVVGPDPLWIDQAGEIKDFRAAAADYGSLPSPGAKEIYRPAGVDDWTVDPAPCKEIEHGGGSLPVKQSAFRLSMADGLPDGGQALQLEMTPQPDVSPHRMRYSTLRPAGDRKIVIPAGTRALGSWVYGNGAAWVSLEIRDAQGRRWHTVSGPTGYDPGMTYRGPHAFDGWRYTRLAFPGEPGARDWHLDGHAKGPTTIALPAEVSAIYAQQHGSVIVINHAEEPAPWRIGPIVCETASQTAGQPARDDPE